MIKKIMLCIFVTSVLLSCNNKKQNIYVPSEPVQVQQEPDDQNLIEAAEEDPLDILVPDVPLGFLVTYIGKYATREKLFQNETFAKRLKGLKRFNYEMLIQHYNTETSLVIIDNIVHMSGCKQHNCPSNAYDFFIDLDNDNINVFYFRTNMLSVYQEKGLINLPPEFVKELDTKKLNAGIGNPESIESNYEL